MKTASLLLATTLLALTSLQAQHGMPADARETIHGLFDGHDTIQREVTETEGGYLAKTTSSDPKVSKLLQSHVDQMKNRLNDGLMVRRWDPAFREFVEHYEDMEIAIEPIENGVQVEVIGQTDAAKLVARNHAGIISRFVSEGWKEHDVEHAAVTTSAGAPETKIAKECCLATEGEAGGACAQCKQGEKDAGDAKCEKDSAAKDKGCAKCRQAE